jgi:hypothetical protein
MDLKEVGYKDMNLKGLVQVCARGLDVSDVEYLTSATRELVASETFLTLIRRTEPFSLWFCCSSTNTPINAKKSSS